MKEQSVVYIVSNGVDRSWPSGGKVEDAMRIAEDYAATGDNTSHRLSIWKFAGFPMTLAVKIEVLMGPDYGKEIGLWDTVPWKTPKGR